MRNRTRWAARVAAGAALACALAGCGGAATGADLAVRPEPRPLSRSAGKTLKLPGDEKFCIVLAPSSQAPGLTGSASGSAKADGSGAASAEALVKTGGKASGTFQVGQSVKNDSGSQVDLAVTLRAAFKYAVDSQPKVARPVSTCSLTLFARDSRNRTLHTMSLASQNTEQGGGSDESTRSGSFTVTIGPGEVVNVFVAGVAAVDARDDESGSARLEMSKLEMEITQTAAPAVKAAGAP